MKLESLHHRLAVGMALAAVAAAWGGAVLTAPAAAAAALGLAGAVAWRPGARRPVLEAAFVTVTVLLAARAAYVMATAPQDRLPAMVAVLAALLVAEAWKPPQRVSDVRLYVLSFALLLASTVLRPGLVFAIAFVAYTALSTVTLMVGHVRRRAARFGARDVPVGRRVLLGTGALSLVTLSIAAIVFLAFPRVSRGWAPGGPALGAPIAGFADVVTLGAHGATIRTNPEVVLRVEFPDGRPSALTGLRWRGRSYDRFDGVRWHHSDGLPPSGPGPDWYRRWEGARIRQEVYSSLLRHRVLFALHPVLDIEARSPIRPYLDRAGDVRFGGGVPPRYVAESVADAPAPAALRSAAGGEVPGAAYYLQLPDLDPRIRALADSLTAGLDTRYDRVRAVESWLGRLGYTRELPATAREATLGHFLFERRAGHCEYFSTAMTVMLRARGIPARNVNGFLGGGWNAVGSYLAVTQNDAHSWVEVWYPGIGWVAHDPTPAAAEAGTADRTWLWPGRLFLDGLRHRWDKWVLDYDVGSQEDLLRQASGFFQDDGEPAAVDHELPAWLVWAAAALAVLAVAWFAARVRTRRPPATRLYLRLRGVYDRAGLGRVPRGAPLRFASALEEAGAPGRREASALVRRYVRIRFGGEPGDAEALRAMRADLRAVRRALRRR